MGDLDKLTGDIDGSLGVFNENVLTGGRAEIRKRKEYANQIYSKS